ncbi:hypothetical protein L3476_28360 [Paenibacillus thiaminolyticus]|uniref:hypothetical protein n=1 Tax=Paenibacillus thiaminolyticus TaxID=49283 RepID=UPI0011634BD6|nr:hypothetical protein [Paenibacillus thiaminolyticus]NGP57792.1 hypothetical protein [Paenibacillus thiaminolyticus]WCR27037.1 hypothetical protein L3476_28360 [Paenibacillus thiaminolyticus]
MNEKQLIIFKPPQPPAPIVLPQRVNRMRNDWSFEFNPMLKMMGMTHLRIMASIDEVVKKSFHSMTESWKQLAAHAGKEWSDAAHSFTKTVEAAGVSGVEAAGGSKDEEGKQQQQKKGKGEEEKTVGQKMKSAALPLLNALQTMGAQAIQNAAAAEDFRSRYQAQYGNAQQGAAVFETMRSQALKSGRDVNQSLESGLVLTSVSKNANDVTKMNEMVQRLAAFRPNENAAGLASSMKEAYFGKADGLLGQLNLPINEDLQKKMESFGQTGNLDGFLEAFDELMTKAGMSQESLALLMESPVKQWELAVNRFQGMLALMGETAMMAFGPVLQLLNQAFEEGRFNGFFEAIHGGLSLLGSITETVVGFLLENWSLVETALAAIGIVVALVAAIWLVQWLIAAWPIFVIIGAIGLLIGNLKNFGLTTGEAIGAIVGAFFSMAASIKNNIALIWNILVAFGEFIVNFFKSPAYSFQKLFYDVMKNVVDYVGNAINTIIRGINKVISFINKLTDSSIETVNEWSTDWVEKIKPTTERDDLADFSKFRMEQTATDAAFKSGQDFIKNNSAFTGDLFKKITDPGPTGTDQFKPIATGMNAPQISKVGEVGKIGKVEGEVDISDEKLMMMRELAEMDSIQNFVTLTPTVQVSTGDIHQGFDFDTLINRIEQKLEEEFVSTAEGVYG